MVNIPSYRDHVPNFSASLPFTRLHNFSIQKKMVSNFTWNFMTMKKRKCSFFVNPSKQNGLPRFKMEINK